MSAIISANLPVGGRCLLDVGNRSVCGHNYDDSNGGMQRDQTNWQLTCQQPDALN